MTDNKRGRLVKRGTEVPTTPTPAAPPPARRETLEQTAARLREEWRQDKPQVGGKTGARQAFADLFRKEE